MYVPGREEIESVFCSNDKDYVGMFSRDEKLVGIVKIEHLSFPYPFAATNVNGVLYGRGVVDMKYFIAEVLSVLDDLKHVGYPVFLLFSSDEETTVEGIRKLMEFLSMRNIRTEVCACRRAHEFRLMRRK